MSSSVSPSPSKSDKDQIPWTGWFASLSVTILQRNTIVIKRKFIQNILAAAFSQTRTGKFAHAGSFKMKISLKMRNMSLKLK